MKIFEVTGSSIQNVKHAVELIKNDCQPFLSNNLSFLKQGKSLFRGISNVNKANDLFMSFDVWANKKRSPTHTPLALHFLADMYMEETFGHAYRSASCFVTTDSMMASRYGTVYGIFPIGDYDMLYSPSVGDFYEWYLTACADVDKFAFGNEEQFMNDTEKYGLKFNSINDIKLTMKEFKHGEIVDSTGEDKTSEFMNYLFYVVFPRLGYKVTKNINDSDGNECMLRCEKYYAVMGKASNNIEFLPLKNVIAKL